MKRRLKQNTSAEESYLRDLARCGSLEKVERGQARVLAQSEYPEPVRRFLARERSMIHLRLSSAEKKKLEQISRATGVDVEELARRWIEQGIARAAG